MENDKTKSNEVPADDEISAEELEQVNGGAIGKFLKIGDIKGESTQRKIIDGLLKF